VKKEYIKKINIYNGKARNRIFEVNYSQAVFPNSDEKEWGYMKNIFN
jgi:hypothetical protein